MDGFFSFWCNNKETHNTICQVVVNCSGGVVHRDRMWQPIEVCWLNIRRTVFVVLTAIQDCGHGWIQGVCRWGRINSRKHNHRRPRITTPIWMMPTARWRWTRLSMLNWIESLFNRDSRRTRTLRTVAVARYERCVHRGLSYRNSVLDSRNFLSHYPKDFITFK